MLKNFFVSAIRNISKHKAFSFLNILGLSIGIALALLIGLFVTDEKSFDRGFTDSERIYRAYYNITKAEGKDIAATTPPTFPAAVKNFPEVQSATRLFYIKSTPLFTVGTTGIYESNGAYVDSNFFDVFDLPLAEGIRKTALASPSNIVISEEMAERYFATTDVVGQRIEMNKESFTVTAVMKPMNHSHLKLNYLLPLSAAGLPEDRLSDWGWYGFVNYIKLKPEGNIDALQKKFQPHVNAAVNKEAGTVFEVAFQKLTDVYLHSAEFQHDLSVRGNITYVNALMVIGVFILLIACFNFINLSTARSLKRAKEVGIKKTLGAERKQLIMQFMFESFLLIIFSTLVAVTICLCTMPLLNWFTGKNISVASLLAPEMLLFIFTLIVVVAVLAGSYPAIALSQFRPVTVLKGGHETGQRTRSTPWVRNALVVTQFALSIMLIICSIIVIKQVNYMQSKDLGFQNDQVMFFSLKGKAMRDNAQTFKTEIQKLSSVKSVSVGYGFPGDMFGDGELTLPATNNKVKSVLLMADADYIPTLNLRLIKGRNFNEKLSTDVDHGFIINETALTAMGFKNADAAIGQQLTWPTWRNQDSVKTGNIIGVVKDFHYKSVHDKIEPVVMQIYSPASSKVAVKLAGNNLESAIEQVRSVWNKFSPDYPLDFVFMDDTFQKMYVAEQKLKTLLSVFTGFAVFVACLGLFGLSAYSAERRKKEISIRKVLGGSNLRLTFMLTFELIKLVCISIVIGIPIAWQIMGGWLENFSYRITPDVWIIIIAAAIAIILASVTVAVQALKAAATTPIKNLKQM
jgi:putative ABC transport system permease protein